MTPELKRKVLIMAGSFVLCATLIVVIMFVIYPRVQYPDRHDEARFGRVYVRLSDDWTQYQRERVGEAAQNLSRMGPTFVVLRAADPAPASVAGRAPRVVLLRKGEWSTRDLSSPNARSPQDACRQEGSGRYELGSSEVWVDPGCAPGEEFVAAVMHEIGHWIGMGHVCHDAQENSGVTQDRPALAQCSPVGRGEAFMNPHTAYGAEEISFEQAASFPVATIKPTRLDHAEFARAWPAFQRRWGL